MTEPTRERVGELSPEELRRLIDREASERAVRLAYQQGPEYREKLKAAYTAYSEAESFSPGDLVEWKPTLRNKSYPEYGTPLIVVEVLDQPTHNRTAEPGSSYYREPLDLAAALLDDDNELVVFWYDSRRLKCYEPT